MVEVGVLVDVVVEVEVFDVIILNKVFLIICDISLCSCFIVILELLCDILVSCDFFCKGELNYFFYI